jgi:23S rRNA pseudouridine1911/1915/1917 synthase
VVARSLLLAPRRSAAVDILRIAWAATGDGDRGWGGRNWKKGVGRNGQARAGRKIELVRTFVTDRGDSRRRLDLVVKRHVGDAYGTTRSQIQAWIENGWVAVDGEPAGRASERTHPGVVVTISVPSPSVTPVTTVDPASLNVLHEDEHLLAVDKPAGLVVHPAYKHRDGTLMDALRAYGGEWTAGKRPSLVGRLDKLTSGVVIVAKSASVHAMLQRALAARDAEKDYLAVVYGRVPRGGGRIDVPLAHDPVDRRRIVPMVAAGVQCETQFERLARVAAPRVGLSLLRCRLVTGRRHQIRVHLASRGWPLVGDRVYGEPGWTKVSDESLSSILREFPRQALHSWRMRFRHPVTSDWMSLEAPLPPDFSRLLDASRLACGLGRV